MKPLALVVENDAGTRKLLGVLLTRLGYEPDLLHDGADAATLAGTVDYQLIIVDLVAAYARGVEVIDRLRDVRPEALRRTVVLTAAPDAQLENMRGMWPLIAILRKPFELQKLTDAAMAAMQDPVQRNENSAHEFSRRSIVAGAKAGLLVRRNGDLVELVTAFGYQPSEIDPWFPFDLSAAFPICDCMRERRALWLESLARARANYPTLEHTWSSTTSRALASVPLFRNGRTIGAAGWSFREPQLFNDAAQKRFTEIAEAAEGLVPESGGDAAT